MYNTLCQALSSSLNLNVISSESPFLISTPASALYTMLIICHMHFPTSFFFFLLFFNSVAKNVFIYVTRVSLRQCF